MRASIAAWLLAWWPGRQAELRRQYRAMLVQSPLVVADLRAFCMEGESTFDAGSARQSDFNEGSRAVWLHIVDAAGVTDDEIRAMRDELHEAQGAVRPAPARPDPLGEFD